MTGVDRPIAYAISDVVFPPEGVALENQHVPFSRDPVFAHPDGDGNAPAGGGHPRRVDYESVFLFRAAGGLAAGDGAGPA